ncbi:MAG: DUF350 domain-containing protein [Halobacteriovoraceae bacterium]|jgi:putative membrane protein|nr:DUF350 domain-containing protein [Halobacteriovoraceae bacterium]MBT5095352.1 DUF350 domain-containing protein [Halobacteriovoraceae bacterium]
MESLINIQFVVNAILFSTIGMILFVVAFKVMDMLFPGDFWHEIIEEHNTALALIMGAMAIGMSVIISGAIR